MTSIIFDRQDDDVVRARYAQAKADKLAANSAADPLPPDDSPDSSPVEARARRVG